MPEEAANLEEMNSVMTEIFLIGGLLFLGIGLITLYHQIQALRWARLSTRWPTTTGTVYSVRIQHYTGGEDAFYRVKMGYTYTVANQQYHGKRIEFGIQPPIWWQDKAKVVASKYSIGSMVTVHYDPENPRVAVLMIGISPTNRLVGWFYSLLPIFLGLLSLGIYFTQF